MNLTYGGLGSLTLEFLEKLDYEDMNNIIEQLSEIKAAEKAMAKGTSNSDI